jgi:hypothetical protein
MIDRVRELIGAVSFHRGLALGALVGSAIAGSTIWARVRDARRPAEPPGPELDPETGQPDGTATAESTSGTATTTG